MGFTGIVTLSLTLNAKAERVLMSPKMPGSESMISPTLLSLRLTGRTRKQTHTPEGSQRIILELFKYRMVS